MAGDNATAIVIELQATAGLADPASRFERLRAIGPIAHSDFGAIVTGYDEAIAILRDSRFNASAANAFAPLGIDDWTANRLTKLFGESLLFDQGEGHSEIRKLVAGFFHPGAIAKMQAQIQESVNRNIYTVQSGIEAGDTVDLVAAFARQVPIEVACTTMGLPIADAPQLAEWITTAQVGGSAFDMSADQLNVLDGVGRDFGAYIDDKLATQVHTGTDCKAEPQPGTDTPTLLSHIAAALVDGKITSDKARALVFLLVGAGFETTSNLIANAALSFLKAGKPNTYDLGALIEETLRAEPPVQVTTRSLGGNDGVAIGGYQFQPGDTAVILLGAVGRDPAKYEHPHQFKLDRYPSQPGASGGSSASVASGTSVASTGEPKSAASLAFGSGAHHCIGHHLARAEATLALRALLPVLSDCDLVAAQTRWRQLLTVRSLETLSVVKAAPIPSEDAATRGKRVRKLQKQRRSRFTKMLAGIAFATGTQRLKGLAQSKAKRAASRADSSERQAQKAVATFGEMRGVLMKYGQMFSFAAPAMDERTAKALAALQDSVEPMAPEAAKALIQAELGSPVEELYARFDSNAVAAASIGQVHRAALQNDRRFASLAGAKVAVKVQYDGIGETVEADLAEFERNQRMLSTFMFPNLDVATLCKELSARISEEVDYRIEAANQTEFFRRYEGHPFIRIPRIVPELSGRTVLTTEWIEGTKWNTFVKEGSQAEKDRVGEIVARFAYAGIHRYGVFQADAHPGNFIIGPGAEWVAVLDFGLVNRYRPDMQNKVLQLVDAIYGTDDQAALRAFKNLGYLAADTKITAQRAWDYTTPIREGLGRPGTITPQVYEKAMRIAYDPRAGFSDIARAANAPAEALLGDRLAYGLLALLSQLNATANWPGLINEYGHGADPSSELGHQEHEWLRSRSRSALAS